jgi:hypothetical protein
MSGVWATFSVRFGFPRKFHAARVAFLAESYFVSDNSHLEEFLDGMTANLPKRLVEVFAECSRDIAMKPADIIMRLKEIMEDALRSSDNAAD